MKSIFNDPTLLKVSCVSHRAANLNKLNNSAELKLKLEKIFFFNLNSNKTAQVWVHWTNGQIFKLLKRNKRSLRNIVCSSSSHNLCKLKLRFYQKKNCMSFVCSCHCDLYFYLFNCMSTCGEKVIAILDIHRPELNLNSKKLIFVEHQLELE